MSDINSNIRIEFDTGTALAQLRNLQAGLSKFHQTLAEGNLAAANAQKGLTASMIQSINATGKFSASQKTVATSTQAFTTALEKNQLSMKEYFRYSAAAATANTKLLTKAFAAEREILNRARRDRVKALQSQYIQLNGATGAFAKTIQVMPKSLAMVNGKFTELGTRIQYAAQRQQFLNQLLKQGSTQLLNFGKNMQWAGRQLMVGLTMPLGMLAGAAAKAFRELEKETVAFRRVYGDMFTSDAETDAAIENIKKIGMEYTKFGIAVKDTMNMAASAAAAGFSGTALENQVKQANKLSVLGQIDQQKALETTISLQNAFGISSDELAKKINFLNAVENQTVVSLDDITTAIPKVAPVIKQLGGSVEDLAFFLTAMEEGGINASEGANALKSGLAALINPGDKATAMLAGLGINIKGIVEGNAGDLKGTVVGFARALDTLAPLQRARAIEQLFGKFQFARLSTLFQNVTKDGSQASRTLQLAGASVEELSILSQREMSKVEDSVGVKFQKAIEQFKVTLMPIGKQFLEAVTPVVEFFGKMLEKFNGLGDGTKKVIGILVAALGFIGPAALMAFGLLANGAANVIKFFAMLRGGIAKLNGQTNVLGAGFDYLTQQETENLAQSNALHTSHQRLISVFNVEKGSLDSLASSYANAATQARSLATSSPGLFAAPGAASAVSKLPKTRKYADGVLSVPGPKGAGDIQPAMLSPGESVIPTKQSQKHRGLIKAIMADNIPGHIKGRLGSSAKNSKVDQSKALLNSSGRLASNTLIRNLTPQQKEAYDKTTKTLRTYSDDKDANLAIDNALKAGVPKQLLGKSLIKLWKDGYYPITSLKKYNSLTKSLATKESGTFFRGTGVSGKQYLQNKMGGLPPEISGEIYQILKTLKGADQAQALSKFVGKPFKMRTSSWSTEESIAGGFAKNTRERAVSKKDVVPFTIKTSFKDQDVIPVHSLFKNMYSQKGVPESERMFGGNFVITGINSKGVTVERVAGFEKGTFSVPGSKGAGDVTPAMLSPGESVIPTKQSEKHRGLIKSIISDNIPGHMAGRIGKIKPQSSREPLFLGMPKTLKETNIRIANQKMLDDIDRSIRNGPLGALEPSNFGKLVTETTGHSFPIPGVGGIYEKGGKQLFVKPVTDIDAARAELLSTSAFTPAHNLIAPKQELRTMLDPTDPKGKRRIAVLVSPYDAKFANPDGKFTQQQMADQLYASSLRGDKDLQTANVSGNMVIDAGTSYAYDKASGLRTQSDSLKSVLEQAHINTLGVKGGARRAFADAVSPIAQKMTADEFHILMSGTVTAHNARLAQTLATTKLTAAEKEFYAKNILARGKEAEDIDWRQIHANLVNLEAAPKKKELTAAAIAKKFEEQLLKKRQSGHANEDFYVQPFDDGTGGVGKSKASLDRIKALPIIDSQSQQEQHRIFQWAEDQMSGPDIRPEAKAKWEKSKVKWKESIAKYLTYDPATGLYYTGKEGERGTPREHLEKALRYNLGIDPATTPKRKGQFASLSDTATGSHALEKISIGGATKGGGGVATNNPGAKALLDEIRLETEARNKALGASGETTKITEYLKSKYPDATAGQINRILQLEAAHIEPGKAAQGEQSIARSKDKWINGQAWDDFGGVNQYMLNDKKHQRILDWDKSFAESPLGLNDKRRSEYQKAADFMASGRHPSTAEEAKLVRDAAQLELLAIEAEEKSKKETGKKPKGFSKYKLNLNKLSADAARFILDGRLGPNSSFYDDLLTQKKIVNLDTNTRTGQISVGKGEGIIPADTKPGSKVKPKKVTGQNSTPRPFGSTTTGPSGERVPKNPGLVASRQTMRFIGKDKGDLTFRNDPTYSPAFTEASDLSKNSQRNVNKLVNEHIANLKKTNTLSKDDIRAKADNYRRYLIADRLEKANQAEYAKTAPARAKLAAQSLKKEQANARKERVGRFSGGASAAVGGLGMAAMMGGADQKVTTGLFAASAVAGLAPMLMNPYVAAGAAVLAVAGSFWYANKKIKEAAENQSRFVDLTRATTEKMKTIGEMNQKVGAAEIMAAKRKAGTANRYTEGFDRGKQQYGATFLGTDPGKEMQDTFSKQLAKGGDQAIKQMALNLGTYVSDGIMSAQQAYSIAQQIGQDMGNLTISSQITGELISLIGPDGKDILTNPIGVRVKIVQDSRAQSQPTRETLEKSPTSTWSISDIPMGETSTKQTRDLSAALAASNVQDLELAQAVQDSLELQLTKEIEKLKVQKAATTDKEKQAKIEDKIVKKEEQRLDGQKKLKGELTAILKQQAADYKLAQKKKSEAEYLTSLETQITEKYKDDPVQKNFLSTLSANTNKVADRTVRIKVQALVAAGFLEPSQMSSLLDLYSGDDAALNTQLNLAVRTTDSGVLKEVIGFVTSLDNKDYIKKALFEKVIAGDSVELMSTLNSLAKLNNKEVSVKTFFEDPKALENLDLLQGKLSKIKEIDSPITAKVLAETEQIGDIKLGPLADIFKKWEGLDPKITRTIVAQYVTIASLIGTPEAIASLKARGVLAPLGPNGENYTPTQIEAEKGRMAAEFTPQAVAAMIAANTPKNLGDGDGNKTTRTYSEINDLLKQIKFLRDASVNAEGKLKELANVTAGKGITKITGVIQQLMKGPKGGYNRDFISWLESMDEATRKTYMSVNKAGKVILSTEGKQAKELFNEASFGRAYNRENTVAQDSLAQAAALVKLKTAGFDTAKALELVADASFAVSVNSGNITPEELKLLKEEAIRAKKEVAALALELKTAAEGSQQGLTDITQKLRILSGLKDRYKLTSDQREAIVSQSKGTLDSLEGYLAGKITGPAGDAIKKDLEKILNSVHPILDGTLNLKVQVDGLQAARDAFSDIQNRFNDFFNAKRSLVASKYRKDLNAAQDKLDPNVKGSAGANAKAAQDELTAAQKAVDAANRANDKKIKTINDNAEKELRVLEKTVKEKKAALDKANKDLKDAEDKANIEQDRYNVQMEYDSYFAADGTVNDGFTKNAKTGVTNPRSIEFLQRNIDTNQRELEEKVNRPLEDAQRSLADFERKMQKTYTDRIDALQETSSAYSDDLTLIDHAAEAINKKYDLQEEALNKISAINDQIISQQKDQLDLASAISSGDIGAAAKAMQQIQASRVSGMAKTQQDALTASRESEISGLTSRGLTREQIEEKQWNISREIIQIEKDSLPLQENIEIIKERIYELEQKRENYLKGIQILEDEIYAKTLARQVALDAITKKEIALKPLQDAAKAAQEDYDDAEENYNDVVKARDEALRALEIAHTDAMVDLETRLTAAEDALIIANDALAAAQAAVDEIQGKIDEELGKITELEDKFLAVQDAIFGMTSNLFDFTTELEAALVAAENLAAQLAKDAQEKKDLNDAAPGLAKDKYTAALKAEKDFSDSVGRTTAFIKSLQDKVLDGVTLSYEEFYGLERAMKELPGLLSKLQDLQRDTAEAQEAYYQILLKNPATKKDALRFRLQTDKAFALSPEGMQAARDLDAEDKKPVVPPVVPMTPAELKERIAKWRKNNPWAASIPDSAIPNMLGFSSGGMVLKYMAQGGFTRGSDIVPAMLTPGEFVMSRYAVSTHGVDKMKAMNNGDSIGDAVYNYSVNVNVKSDANPDEIARAVMMQIKQVDGQKIRGNRF